MTDVQTIPEPKPVPAEAGDQLSDLNGAQLQARFEEKEESLKEHVDALAGEVRDLLDQGGDAIRDNPGRVIAGVAVGAVAVGLLIGLARRRDGKNEEAGLGDMLDGYSEAFVEEVSEWLDKGKSVREAVSNALRGARPVIYFEPPPERAEPESSRSKVKQTAGSLAKAALGYALKAALAEGTDAMVRRRGR